MNIYQYISFIWLPPFLKTRFLESGCPLSPSKFNVYAARATRGVGMEEAEEGLRLGGRKINSLRYAYDTTLIMANITGLQNLTLKEKSSSEEAVLFLNV